MDIFAGTIAEMTWFEVDEAAQSGAVLLWPIGVIEQHGPHLPTGTDVYIPTARARMVKAALAERGVTALVVPAYYWGVNVVSGSFPASYGLEPHLMREVLASLLGGFARDGFRHVFCISGHGDALHNQTIHEALVLAAQRGIDASFVIDHALARRLGLEGSDPCLTLHGDEDPGPVSASSPSAPRDGATPTEFVDVHAGRWETSMMLHSCSPLVRVDVAAELPSTDYGAEDLAQWRRGYDDARAKTPLGYFGDPARGSEPEGARSFADSTAEVADAIVRRLSGDDVR